MNLPYQPHARQKGDRNGVLCRKMEAGAGGKTTA
nr:MAG TPA: hypothetical protein [Caudoviricetes sp.]